MYQGNPKSRIKLAGERSASSSTTELYNSELGQSKDLDGLLDSNTVAVNRASLLLSLPVPVAFLTVSLSHL